MKKYPKLILEGDALPPPDRFYKKRVFFLGLPPEKRDKIYFRAQYPPHPEQIEIFRQLVEPLIKGGVYELTNTIIL